MMNLVQNPTDALYRNRALVILLLLGSFQLAFADTAYDPTAGENRESQIDLSLPPEFHGQASDISRPDFSGSWVLDESASDDLKEATRAAQNKGPRPGRGDRGSGGRRGGRGPRPGGDGASSENSGEEGMSSRSKRGQDVMAELSARRLEIVHKEPLLRITTERQGMREVYTDFRGASISALGGMDQSIVTGGWEGDVLVIESTRVNGERTVQHLRLLERPLRLERISNLPGRSGKNQLIQIKQIFVPEGIINDKEEKGGDMESSYFKRLED